MIANTGLLEENGAQAPATWDDMVALIDVIDKEEGGIMKQAVANYLYTGENSVCQLGQHPHEQRR